MSRPGAVVVLAVAVCALSLLVSALVSVGGGVQGQQDDSVPQPPQQDGDFRVFEFGSMEERGEYVHCVSFVSPDEGNPGWLLPSDETCYKEEPGAADIGLVGAGSVSGQQSGSNVIIGKHYDYEYWRGPSLTIVGRNCAGGGITLTGGRWDNRISSTRNGCSIIQHFSYSRPYVFSGTSISTVGHGANLGVMNNRTSGILYFGTLQPFVPPPTTPPSTAPPPPPAPPRPQPPAPQPVQNNITNIDVVAIEVTQGVQDWNNNVRLVKGRPTVVRVFMNMGTNSAMASASVSADLVVSKVGSSDTETLEATNEGGRVTVASGVASRRGRLDASLNFILPEKWTKLASSEELNLSLRFGSGITNRCDAPANAQQTSVSGTCSVKVSFVDVVEPHIFVVPFEVVDNETCEDNISNVAGASQETVSSTQIDEQVGRIFSNMPFSQNLSFDDATAYIFHSQLRISNTCNITNILNLLEARRTYEVGYYAAMSSTPVFYAGILPCDWELPDDNIAGSAEISQGVAAWTLQSASCTGDIAYSGRTRNVGPHEIGHLLGLHHPVRDALELPEESKIEGEFAGVCGETADIKSGFSDFNDIDINGDGRITNGKDGKGPVITEQELQAISQDEFFATLGPIGDDMTEVWGFDVRLFQQRSRISVGRKDTMIISDPSVVFSLMSYCDSLESYNQVLWMDRFHHNEIINSRMVRGSSSVDLNTTPTSQVLTVSELISGVVDLSSSGSPVGVSLNPVHSRTVGSWTNSSGDYKLDLLNSSDAVLRSIPFEAGVIEVTCNSGACPSGSEPNKALFSLVINNPPDYKKLRFSKSGTTFATITRSASAPSLYGPALTLPVSADQAASGDIVMSWTAIDRDDDNLKYTVFYSTDAGRTYSVLLMNTDATDFTVSPDVLAGSDTARIAVSASDGLRADFGESTTFSVTNKYPVARIAPLSSPDTSAGGIISGRQSLVLSASGYDLEDGNLPSVAFSWRSSIDGDLGTGRYIVVSGADLSAGEHEITMTATDSAGNQVTDETQITVSEYEILPEAIDDSASASLDDAVFVDVVANDINIDPGVARASLNITNPPVLGEATVAVSPSGLRSIKYTGHTSGTDTLGYRICDETDASNCSEAILNISVAIDTCTIIGTEGDDILEGTTGNDVICGMGGDDHIDGKRGNDVIYGGSGDDILYGRDGDDIIYGGSGDDLILGHRGDDVLYGRLGDDRIYGGGGNDIATGGKGSDRLHGEADDDTLEGNQDADVIHGGRGDDTIIGGPGDDTIRGNQGTDTIYLGEGTDTLLGTSPQDNVVN